MTPVKMDVSAVVVDQRFRRDLGNVEGLAASIRAVGLLHPPVVTPQGRLVAGARRLAAVKLLGWTSVPVTVAHTLTEARALLEAERDENVERKSLAPSEAVALADALEPLERAEAKRRMVEAGRVGGRAKGTENFTDPSAGESREKVAAAVGYSAPILTKAREIVRAAATDPAYASLVEDMDDGKPVVSVHAALKRQQRAEEAVRIAATLTDEDYGIHHGDFREVGSQLADGSVGLVFTDPPYDRETVPLYGDLAAFSDRVLKPGGSLVTYVGAYAIPDVLDLVLPHLSWWWIITLLHPGAHSRMLQRGVIVEKKSLLWFVKGNSRAERSLVADVITCDRDKRFHEWGQGIAPALHLIERLTAPGELVADPFVGGGTTVVAARQLGRRGWACDVDAGAVAIARARLRDVSSEKVS